MSYTIPASTRIGHVHLKVADIPRALKFYQELLGFQIRQWYGTDAVFHFGGRLPSPYRTEYLVQQKRPRRRHSVPPDFSTRPSSYPTRKDLAFILKSLMEADYPLTGMSDHGVSEAIYLNDPDGNGVELYWDRPKELWPRDAQGDIEMGTEALDLKGLLAELDR